VSTAENPRPSVIETRLDTALDRLGHLTQRAPMSVRQELREIYEELVRVRRDLTDGPALRLIPPDRRGGSWRNLSEGNRRRSTAKQHAGMRRCNRHDEAKGAWLPVSAFSVKNRATGTLRSWCRECVSAYQRERYVRVASKHVTVELVEGDRCIGHDCPDCGLPFEIGDRVRGADLRHEECSG
jgi:hypothetical protein